MDGPAPVPRMVVGALGDDRLRNRGRAEGI